MALLPWLAIALRAPFLGTRSLWFDEASTFQTATRAWPDLVPYLLHNEANPPLYYGMMKAWVAVFGASPMTLRSFSLLCGLASLMVFRGIVERALPEKARLPALAFAGLCSSWVHASLEARVYAWMLLLALVLTRLVFELDERPTPRLWAAYALTSALGLLSHYYFGLLILVNAVWLAPRKDRRWLFAHGAIAALFTPWLPYFLEQGRIHMSDPVMSEPLDLRQGLDIIGTALFDTSFLGLALPSWIRCAVGSAALTAIGSSLGRRDAQRRTRLLCATYVALPFVVVLTAEFLGGRSLTQARYFTIFSPFLLLGLALTRVPALITGTILTAGSAVYLASGVLVDPHFDALAAFVRRSTPEGTPVVHMGTYYYLPMRAWYLPERRHYLLPEDAWGMDYRGMPGYSGVIEEKDLPGLGPCVVIDESRTLSPERVWSGSGAVLSGALSRKRRSP